MKLTFNITLLMICILLLSSCASSTAKYTPLANGAYIVEQQGVADIEMDATGKVKITNPTPTLIGIWIEFKNIIGKLAGTIKPQAELNK